MNHTSLPQLVVVADDLTGAADSAARCVQAGLAAEIWLEASQDRRSQELGVQESRIPESAGADVVALSTDSRFLLPEEARQRVASTIAILTQQFQAPGITWYKKIDSTLRGNLGAELDVMLDALPARTAVVCPAFPAQGRGLEGGKLVYADAPPHHLPSLLREQSASLVGTIELSTVRQGIATLEQVLREHREQGEKLLVVDALTDDDLETIVAAARDEDYLLCGSAGIVAPLAAQIVASGVETGRREDRGAPTQVVPGPILAVVGSGSRTAHAQVAQIAATDAMRVRMLDHSWYEVDLVSAQCHPVGDWLIHLAPPLNGAELEGPVARAQAARLADLAYAAVEKLQPSTLMVVGGDTAHYVLRRLGIERLTVVEELLPGIPLTVGVDRDGDRRAVILKPGNFGDAQTLVALHEAVQQRQA